MVSPSFCSRLPPDLALLSHKHQAFVYQLHRTASATPEGCKKSAHRPSSLVSRLGASARVEAAELVSASGEVAKPSPTALQQHHQPECDEDQKDENKPQECTSCRL